MKVLMLGWEFPPVMSGGLGVATKNLATSLAKNDIDLTFCIPRFVFRNVQSSINDFDLVSGFIDEELFRQLEFDTTISSAYQTETHYSTCFESYKNQLLETDDSTMKSLYGDTLFREVDRYAYEVSSYADSSDFEIVHAHDWMTYSAASKIKEKKDIQFIAHIHATEMDRTGGSPNQVTYDREKKGFEDADHIVAVSHYTRNTLIEKYGISPEKIEVIHNGREDINSGYYLEERGPVKNVIFLGRITVQKGPDYFLEVAKRVLCVYPNVHFHFLGTGDMMQRLMHDVAGSGLSNKVFFHGFVGGKEREEAFANADIFIMPSVSEPFGLVALESVQRDIPVIISKQSGAAEVVKNCFQTDFWDVKKMSDQVISLLHFPSIGNVMKKFAHQDIEYLTWDEQAQKVHNLYKQVL